MPKTKSFDQIKALKKAQKLFWMHGYASTSMNDLVVELGISRSSIYDTFIDKYNFYLSALESYTATKISQWQNDIEYSTNAIKTIESFLLAPLHSKSKGCFVVHTMVEFGNSDPNINHIVSKYQSNMNKQMTLLIESGKVQKLISKKIDSKITAKLINQQIELLHLMARAGKSQKDMKSITQMTLNLVH